MIMISPLPICMALRDFTRTSCSCHCGPGPPRREVVPPSHFIVESGGASEWITDKVLDTESRAHSMDSGCRPLG